MNRLDLKHKLAVVTGSAQGIGCTVAERLLASGARVVLWDLDQNLVRQAAGALGDNAFPGAASSAQEKPQT